MSKLKIEIKNRITGSVLFEYEKENNTLKDTLKEAVKQGADLGGADLGGANLEGADLRGADLGSANLEGTNLRGADLGSANLEGTNLRGADLGGANLGSANLEGADLGGANLGGANLGSANLEGADLRGAYLYTWDDSEPDIKEVIKNVEESSSIRIKSHYINKHILSPYYLVYWKNGLIIDDYEIVEPEKETKEMTLEEISQALGYDVKIVKESDK